MRLEIADRGAVALEHFAVRQEQASRRFSTLPTKALPESRRPPGVTAAGSSVPWSADTKRIQFHGGFLPLPIKLQVLTDVLQDATYNVYWYSAERKEIKRIINPRENLIDHMRAPADTIPDCV